MSLYNLLFGENKDAVALLGMIKCKKEIEEADDPNSPAAKRMKDIGEQIIKQIDNSNSDINIIGL